MFTLPKGLHRLVGVAVDTEKLDQTPTLLTWITIALVVSTVILGLFAIAIARMMRNTEDVGLAESVV